MLRASRRLFYQVGVHTSHVSGMQGARMKHWPTQEIPQGFRFTPEQRFRLLAMPRDTGRIPRNFVLGVLFKNQPATVSSLWECCCQDPGIVLDSRRHLREILKQTRDEGFIYFEKDKATDEWQCLLTRERFEEVKELVTTAPDSAIDATTLRGEALQRTTELSKRYENMIPQEKEEHLVMLRQEVARTSEKLRTFTRNEIDYLPYTDLNSKVNFMWWYEGKEGALSKKMIPAAASGAALPL